MMMKQNPEHTRHLDQLRPVQTYTREQVSKIMTLLAGVVIDGEPIKEWAIVEETAQWIKVELLLDSYLDPRYDSVEHWYFYKRQ